MKSILPGADYDLIVIGAGCAGMATALFAAIEGMKVLVLERTQWVGGTSALAAGALWIPNTPLAAGSGDTPERAARYLELSTGGRTPAALRKQFLSLGPQAVRVLEAHSEVHLRAFARHPDYLSELEGSTTHGRALECLPFDGRQLGAAFALLRPPIPEFTVLGGMMVDRIDIGHLLKLTRSAASFAHAARLLWRYLGDRLRHPRGTRLVMGNALVGRLLHSLRKRQVPVWTQASVDRLLEVNGRVTGVEVNHAGERRVLHARAGVVLAGGGFNEHPKFRQQLIPAEVRHSPRAGASPALLLEQTLALGARLGRVEGSAAFLTPVSVRTRRDGSTAVFPHFVLDRGKPGTVVVNAQGRRFVNESASYQLFGEAMLEPQSGQRPNALAFLIADRTALVKYGLGMVRPGGRGIAAALRGGYLVRAPSVRELAQSLEIDPRALSDTVERMNRYAQSGLDEEFRRGSTPYQTNLGDPAVGPNPNLGRLDTPPFYALRLVPGDIGAAVGLVTDADARVLRGEAPIEGLFAVGNDMHSVMGDAYPGPGITLGPAVVFAFAAARAARRSLAPAGDASL